MFWASDEGLHIVKEIEDDARMRNEGMTDAELDAMYDEAVGNDSEASAMQAFIEGGQPSGSNPNPFAYDYSSRPAPPALFPPTPRDQVEDNRERKRGRELEMDGADKRTRHQSAQEIMDMVRKKAEQRYQL